MDNIIKVGSREKIKQCILSELSVSPADAEKVFDYLDASYLENTEEFGRIEEQGSAWERELVSVSGEYYINLPRSVLVVIALILDITLTKGIVSGVCGMLGVQTQLVYHINQHKGETCLLRECLRNHNAADADGYSYLTGYECMNNDLACQYRDGDGRCCIQKTEIEEVLAHFKEAQIITG